MLSWHVALTEPFKGVLAEQAIAAKGFEVFNPKVRELRHYRKRKPVEMIRPLVIGYIFARFDREVDKWERIRDCRGVKDFMYGAEEIPARVRDSDLKALMSLCVDGFIPQQAAHKFLFKVGTMARVVEGPFASFEGKVVKASHEMVQVLINVFGRLTPVQGPATDFEPVG